MHACTHAPTHTHTHTFTPDVQFHVYVLSFHGNRWGLKHLFIEWGDGGYTVHCNYGCLWSNGRVACGCGSKSQEWWGTWCEWLQWNWLYPRKLRMARATFNHNECFWFHIARSYDECWPKVTYKMHWIPVRVACMPVKNKVAFQKIWSVSATYESGQNLIWKYQIPVICAVHTAITQSDLTHIGGKKSDSSLLGLLCERSLKGLNLEPSALYLCDSFLQNQRCSWRNPDLGSQPRERSSRTICLSTRQKGRAKTKDWNRTRLEGWLINSTSTRLVVSAVFFNVCPCALYQFAYVRCCSVACVSLPASEPCCRQFLFTVV